MIDSKEEFSIKEGNKALAVPRSAIEDIIDETYKIHLNEEITELSNEFCKYYNATNIDTDEGFFAIIFSNRFLHPIRELSFLAKRKVRFLNQIYSYAVVTLSSTKEEKLVAIVDKYDYTDNLATYLQKGFTIDSTELEQLTESLVSVFWALDQGNIYCYSVNPGNILMKDGKFFALREFIDSYPYFYQKDQYIAPELAECHIAGRFINNSKSDIYALGVTMFEAYTGKAPWNEHKSIIDYNGARFENTTSKYLLSRIRIPEKLRVFFKWTLHDEANIRWKLSNLKDWLDGKITKLAHESIIDNKNTVAFNDHNYSTAKSVSYALFNNWHEATKFIKDNKLFKWVSREQISSDVLEQIKALVDTKAESAFIVSNVNSHVKVAKLLPLLDPNGPIRHDEIAFSAASIPYLISYLISFNKREIAEKAVKLIKEEAWIPYSKNPEAAGYLQKVVADDYKFYASHVQTGSVVKSLERFLYSLNKHICCNSPLLNSKYATTIEDLLIGLDRCAEKRTRNFNVDRNIIAFVAAKLRLSEDIKSSILTDFPRFADHPVIKSISVFNILQQHKPEIKITNVCKAIAEDLKELFQDYLHNVEFKKRIISQLDEVAKEGNLEKIIQILADQQQFVNDYNGYYDACRQAKLIEQQIKSINNEDGTFRNSLLVGQKVTVLMSYVLCFIVTIAVIL
ncbi:MAG: hypothetical protein Tsb006_0360 [Rickettsiaceae bacterium]